ncbi:MAG: FlgD immunoglobulin-like domain containing protein [Bacteroidota bacterium]|nr:FlgD immunoglobulin-like domain containing protein [Bacteroidota bacterium]
MKSKMFLSLFVAGVIAATTVVAQVYVEFMPPMKRGNRPYTPLPTGTGTTVYTASSFITTPTPDPDDGFAVAQLPFPFEFNGTIYNYIAINVNGFIMFLDGPTVPLGLVGMNIPTRLFDGQQFPRNVVAPFWGDHYMRVGPPSEPQYMPSQVLTRQVTVDGRDAFCIEWRNLNINNKNIPSSVGNFQVYLYRQSQIVGNFQGDIEFAYGTIGGNPNTPQQTVVTRDASVGLKGSSPQGDWINGLEFGGNVDIARTSTRRTNLWPPSGGTDSTIVFQAIPRVRLDVWGDGDADFSQAPGQRHSGQPQNIFVTANDALLILRAVATGIPLDSLYRRPAFKGDVDHNGRYYYSTRNWNNTADTARHRREIRTRSRFYTDDLPVDNSLDIRSIYFYVNAYDAALIMHYLGGRVPELPWLIDSVVPAGKLAYERARMFELRTTQAVKVGNVLRVPIYVNGFHSGALSIAFDAGIPVEAVDLALKENMLAMAYGTRVAIAGSAECGPDEPVAWITIPLTGTEEELHLRDVEFNGERQPDFRVRVAARELQQATISASPNPFYGSTTLMVSIPENGNYTIAIYDAYGKVVATLAQGYFAKGTLPLTWNGMDANGTILPSGVYFCRLEGNGSGSVVEKVILER